MPLSSRGRNHAHRCAAIRGGAIAGQQPIAGRSRSGRPRSRVLSPDRAADRPCAAATLRPMRRHLLMTPHLSSPRLQPGSPHLKPATRTRRPAVRLRLTAAVVTEQAADGEIAPDSLATRSPDRAEQSADSSAGESSQPDGRSEQSRPGPARPSCQHPRRQSAEQPSARSRGRGARADDDPRPVTLCSGLREPSVSRWPAWCRSIVAAWAARS